MRKNFILDTNVLLYDPTAIGRFDDNHVIIPIEVIEELDSFKRDVTELGKNARDVCSELDRLRQQARLGEGVRLENGGLLRVFAGQCRDSLAGSGLRLKNKVDGRILNLAVYLTERDPDQATIIVTKSVNLRVKADALGIYAEDYEDETNRVTDIVAGFSEVETDLAGVQQFREDDSFVFEDRVFPPNEYILLHSANGQVKSEKALGRIIADGKTMVPLQLPNEGVLGIRPLNVAQSFALDALLNDDIKLVTLLGKAGTGKTLLAVAAGLSKVMQDEIYNRLLVSRPTMPMGRDIGYIPGDINEKMRPWMQPIYDAIELVREIDRRSRKRSLPQDILESAEIGIEPLTYIRGRSIPHQFLIIDEAQNLTPHEVKTVITRVGQNTKVVLTGDPHQIDNPYINAHSSGFIYVINRMRPQSISAHVALTKGERSELAEVAANIL